MSGARCFHCDEPLGNSTLWARVGARREPVCCAGCQAVAELLQDSGLDDFYRRRTGPSPRPTAGAADRWSMYADPQLAAELTQTQGDRVSATLIIEGLRCTACAWLIERTVGAVPGVCTVSVNAATGHALIAWRAGQHPLAEVMRCIARLGYVPHLLSAAAATQVQRQERRTALKQLVVASFGMMQVMMFAIADYAAQLGGETLDPVLAQYFRVVSLWVSALVLYYAARPFLVNGWRQLRSGALGMDVPVAAALVLGFSASAWNTLHGAGEVYFDSITMFVFFLNLSRCTALWVRHQTSSASIALAQHLPAVAQRWRDGRCSAVPLRELQPGDEVVVWSGAVLPADGVVSHGTALLNEAWLTGESLPVQRALGSPVSGGSINAGSPIRVRVTATAQGTQLAGVAALLLQAQAQKPAALRMADRHAAIFTRCVLTASVAVLLTWLWLDAPRALPATLAVLIVACPCAFSIAMPATLASVTAALARRGVLVTRVDALEAMARIERVIFDKTGTLTRGVIGLERCEPQGSLAAADCLAIAAALERTSEHPLAAAFRLHDTGRASEHIVTIAGRGIEGVCAGQRYRIGTPEFVGELCGVTAHASEHEVGIHIVLGNSHELLATFALRDVLREDAAAAVLGLTRQGVSTQMLSGDSEPAVREIAQRCGIDAFRARCTPQHKLAHVRALQRRGERIAAVGDGINDAPVLAAADVSVAMGRGAALAQATADVIMVNERPAELATLLRLARQAVRVARQNLLWSGAYNLSALPLAAFGLIPPWLAAVGMAASSILVLLNALRLGVRAHVRARPGASSPPLLLAGAARS